MIQQTRDESTRATEPILVVGWVEVPLRHASHCPTALQREVLLIRKLPVYESKQLYRHLRWILECFKCLLIG